MKAEKVLKLYNSSYRRLGLYLLPPATIIYIEIRSGYMMEKLSYLRKCLFPGSESSVVFAIYRTHTVIDELAKILQVVKG